MQANELKSRRRSPESRVGDRLFLSPASFPFLAATAAPRNLEPRCPAAARPHHAVRAAAAQGEQPFQADPGEPPARPPPAARRRLLLSGEGCGCRGRRRLLVPARPRFLPLSAAAEQAVRRPGGEGGREAGRDAQSSPPLPGFAALRPRR